MPFLLTAITADPVTILAADAAGVDRIGIDIERLYKTQRQGQIPGARISVHQLRDLRIVSANVRRAEVFIRINPLHPGTREEIETALSLGARAVMLPYFTTAREADTFANFVGGRAAALLLVETAAAARNIHEIVAVHGISEVMVGLNDLHLELGLSSHFDVVAADLLGDISAAVRGAGLRFGFGGLARVDDTSLPVAPDLVCAQYPRLSATSAWLSRSFFRDLPPSGVGPAVSALRRRLEFWTAQPPEVLDRQRQELINTLAAPKT